MYGILQILSGRRTTLGTRQHRRETLRFQVQNTIVEAGRSTTKKMIVYDTPSKAVPRKLS